MINSFKSWLSNKTLSFKLSVSILACVILGFVTLVGFISKRSEPIIRSQIESNAEKSVDAYASDFTYIISGTEHIVSNTTKTLSQVSETDITAVQLLLNFAIKTVDDHELKFTNAWVYIFSPDDVSKGTLYISKKKKNDEVVFQTEKIANFYDKFPWLKEVPKVEKIYWSEPYIDADTKKTVLTTLQPFMFQNNTDFNGLMALTVDLSDLQDSINNFSFYDTGKLLLLSRNGLYVTHPNPDIVLKKTIFELGQTMNLPELIHAGQEIKEGRSGSVSIPYSSVFDGKAVFFYAPVGHSGWGICLVYPESEFFRPIRQFQFMLVSVFIGGVAFLLLIINLICKYSTSQLLELSKIATQYGNGRFRLQFDKTPSSKEMGILSSALNNMRQNLLDYIEKEKKEASERQQAESEMAIAQSIQKSALRTTFPKHPAFKMFALMVPAKQVGGDFYDFFFLNESKLGLVMADVSGKGIPAALYMMKGQTLIKNIAQSGLDISEVFYLANNELCEGNETCMFISAFLGIIDLKTGLMQYVNAGHTPPLIDFGDGYKYIYPKRNIVLGIKKNVHFKSERLKLRENTKVFLYTDGVTEAENQKSGFYGEKRLLNILQKRHENSQKTLKAVLSNIQKFANSTMQSDDITMMEVVYQKSPFSEIDIEADIKNLGFVLDYIKQDMQKYFSSEKIFFKMITCAEEIFSNIASYAYEGNEDRNIKIKSMFDGIFYHLTFIDKGKAYDPLLREDPDISRTYEDRNIGGLGVFLVKKFADDVSYKREDNQNIFKISIRIK